MDYTSVPSLASEMLRNFTDCALTLPFNSRHVVEIHGLPNDGYQVPRSGQAKVTSHQKDGPRTKLGYNRVLWSQTMMPMSRLPLSLSFSSSLNLAAYTL